MYAGYTYKYMGPTMETHWPDYHTRTVIYWSMQFLIALYNTVIHSLILMVAPTVWV